MDSKKRNIPVPAGTLLIIGGHEDKGETREQKVSPGDSIPMEILKSFIALTGKENPVIECITTATQEPQETYNDYKKAFESLGIPEIGHIHHEKRSEVLTTDLTERIKRADGIFFSGGDQMKLTSLYGGTSFLLEIKYHYIRNKVVLAGTSAGAMALSTPMIYSGSKEKQQLVGEVRLTTGLEFLKDVCVDTHFVDRSRFVRMAQVLAMNPTSIGLGIEEDTAVIVRKGVELEVIGSGVVIVLEGKDITESNITEYGSGKTITIRDLNVLLLGKGNLYTIEMRNPPHL